MRAVLHAHPDRWTVGLGEHLPPEERTRLRAALVAAAVELLGGSVPAVDEPDELVEDTGEQRDAIRHWRAHDPGDVADTLRAAFDGVVSGAFWEAPALRTADVELRFHAGWRLVVESERPVTGLAEVAARHGLLVRDRQGEGT